MSKKLLGRVLNSLLSENEENAIKMLSSYIEIKAKKIIEGYETIYLTAPSEWAPYLFNDDPSGLEDDEIEAVDSWIEALGYGAPVGCEDAGFIKHHDATFVYNYAADCQTYAFLKRHDSDVNDDMPHKHLGDEE